MVTEQCAGMEVAVLRCIVAVTDRDRAELPAERGQCVACASGSAPFISSEGIGLLGQTGALRQHPYSRGALLTARCLPRFKARANSQCCFPLLIPIHGVSRSERGVLTPTVALRMLRLTWMTHRKFVSARSRSTSRDGQPWI